MPYTRRDLIRDAALISATGAAAGLPFALGQKRHKAAPLTAANPSAFKPGVRIFFSGSWLFQLCPVDNTQTTMIAVSRDMPTLPHNFPYGRWNSSCGIDNGPNFLTRGNHSYSVNVSGFTAASGVNAVNKLFDDSVKNGGFYYLSHLTNQNQDLTIQPDNYSVVITIPIPTCITLAAFQSGGSVINADPSHPGPAYSGGKPPYGVATTHIFDYQGASSLTFGNDHLNASVDSTADYHFHTVPKSDPGFSHARSMFDNLLSLLHSGSGPYDRTLLSLSILDTSSLSAGPFVPLPPCVSLEELEMKVIPPCKNGPMAVASIEQAAMVTLASCAGGSMGIGS